MWMISYLAQILFPVGCLSCRKKDVPICNECIRLMRRSLSVPEPFIISAFDFKDDIVRRAIHSIKYHHRADLIGPLTDILAREIEKHDLKDALLVPIPMPKIRKLMRGYNQAELIAEHLSQKLGIPMRTDILIRADSRKRQATIQDRATRLRNQSGSFKLAQGVKGVILLIDDVTTTGATLLEAKKVLEQEGVRIYAATLAH